MKARVVPLSLGVLSVLAAGVNVEDLLGTRARAPREAAVAPVVSRAAVVTPKAVASDRSMVLPGTVEALDEAVVCARVSGYARRGLVDVGDDVHEGQVLAEIDTPELDDELEQSVAQLAQAQASTSHAIANRDHAKSTLERYVRLGSVGLAAQHDLEQSRAQSLVNEADVGVALARTAAQEANIRRLTHLKSFARVLAPFDGTIVSRTMQRGARVTTGNTVPLFKMAKMDSVRVVVRVPQDVAPALETGLAAEVTVPEYPGQVFQGVLSRADRVIDPTTHTMTAFMYVPNPAHRILLGMHVRVSLTLSTPHRVLEIPATALWSDAEGGRVAIVDGHRKVRFVPIVIERDAGATLEVASGLDGDERIVKIARPDLLEGEEVQVVP